MTRKFMSPLTLGFIVSGILFFVIVAVVRYAITDTSSIDQVTAAGAQSFQQVAAQQSSNVGQTVLNELPVFTIPATVTPQVSVFPPNPEWLTTTTDEIGRRWVWVESMWFDCPFVANAKDAFFLNALGATRLRDLREVCK